MPFLGNQYGVELHGGKLMLKFDQQEGTFAVWAYNSHKLPICPLHYRRILGHAHPELERLGDAFEFAGMAPANGASCQELKNRTVCARQRQQ